MEKSHFTLVVPNHSVRWFPEGEHCTDPSNCDILLVDHGDLGSTVIEDAEKIATLREPELKGFTWCGHAGILRTDLGPTTVVSEMKSHGLARDDFETYRARRYAVVNLEAVAEQRAAAAKFDDAMLGADYGWLEYPSIILDDATGLSLAASWSDHIICSTHAMLVANALGFFGDRLPVRTEPMRIALWLGAKPS